MDTQRLHLSIMNGDGGQQMSAAKLSEYSGAPSKRTLQYWKSHAGNPLEADLTRKLAPDQLKIISGFIFFLCGIPPRMYHHGYSELCADKIFCKTLSELFISKHVHKLGFSSQQLTSLKITFGGVNTAKFAVDFLHTNQPVFSIENFKSCCCIRSDLYLGLWRNYQIL